VSSLEGPRHTGFVQAHASDGAVHRGAAQSLAFVLTLQQVPHASRDDAVAVGMHGTWLFMLLSIGAIYGFGARRRRALIIFGRYCSGRVRLGIIPCISAGLVISMGSVCSRRRSLRTLRPV